MIYKFFKNVETFEELKEQYKKLVFKYHPDKGGKTEDMQQVNAEYDDLKNKVKDIHRDQTGKTYTAKEKTASDIPDRFRAIINAIINFNVDIELCGSWLWIFKGYPYRTQLKNLGFFYCPNKKAWAWAEKPTDNKHRLTIEEIRKLHGSEIIKEAEDEEEQKQINGAA